MESLGRMVAVILAVILLILFPLRYDAMMERETVESYVHQEMEYFLHQMIERRYVDISMYENFIQQLNASGDIYIIEIERYCETSYQEEARNSVTYENVRTQLTKENEVTFELGDHLVLSIEKTSDSFYDQLSNLFLPMFPANKNVTMGGSIQ